MKKISLITLLVAFMGCAEYGTPPLTDAENLQLNGKVKQLTQVIKSYRSAQGIDVALDTIIVNFNPKGYITELQQRKMRIIGTDTIAESSKRIYHYQSRTLVTATEHNDRGEEIATYSKKLNKQGHPLEITIKKGNVTYTNEYAYSKGDTEAKTTFTTSEEIKIMTNFTFDERGRILTEEGFDEEGKLRRKVFYHYNDKGFIETIKKESDFEWDKGVQQYKYQYDSNGSATEIEEYNDGKLQSTTQRRVLYY